MLTIDSKRKTRSLRIDVVLLVVFLEILLGISIPVVSSFFVVSFLLLFGVLLFFAVKIDRAYVLLILLLPVTNLGFSIYPPEINRYNVFYLFHIASFVLFLCYCLNKLIRNERGETIYLFQDIVVMLFVFWALIGVLWSPDLKYAVFRALQLLGCALAYVVVTQLIVSEEELRNGVKAWIYMSVAASFGILLSVLLKEEIIYVFLKSDWSDFVAFVHLGYFQTHRGSGFAQPKFISNFVNVGILLCISRVIHVEGRRKKLKYLVAMTFMFFSVLFTMARGPLGGLLVGLAFVAVAVRKLRRRLIGTLTIYGFTITIIFMAYFGLESLVKAYHEIGLAGTGSRYVSSQALSSLEARVELWQGLYEKFIRGDSYFLGMGTGASAFYLQPIPHSHGIVQGVVFDLGFLGFLVLCLGGFVVVRNLIMVTNDEDSYWKTCFYCLYGGLIAYCVNGLIEFDYFVALPWVYLAILSAMMRLRPGKEMAD